MNSGWVGVFAVALAIGAAASWPTESVAANGSICRPGASIEARAWDRWWPAVVVEARTDGTCVVKHKAYAGVENMEHMQPDRIRPAQGAPHAGIAVGARPSRPGFKGQLASPAPRSSSGTSLGAAVSTTPEKIYQDFDRNPAAATERYINRRVQITGIADRIEEDSITFFRLGMDLVAKCTFEPADRAALGRVAKGRQVTVTGFGATRVSHHVIHLTGCRLVGTGGAPAQASIPPRPPLGEYQCMAGGRPVGKLLLRATTYTVNGVTGGYAFDKASGRFTWKGGAYPGFGWSGRWEGGPPRRDGRADPRITLRDGKRLEVSCLPVG